MADYHGKQNEASLIDDPILKRKKLMESNLLRPGLILEDKRMAETQAFIEAGLDIPPNWTPNELLNKVSEIFSIEPLKSLVLKPKSSFYIFMGLKDISDDEAFKWVSLRAQYTTADGEVKNSRPALTHPEWINN